MIGKNYPFLAMDWNITESKKLFFEVKGLLSIFWSELENLKSLVKKEQKVEVSVDTFTSLVSHSIIKIN